MTSSADGSARSRTPGGDSGSNSWRRLAAMLRPHAWSLGFVLMALLALTGVNILVPALTGMIFNRVFPERDWSLLSMILGGMFILFVLRNALYFMSKYRAVKVGEEVSFDLRTRLFEHLQQMNLQFYRENQPGRLSSRLMNDSNVIQSFIQDEMPKLLQAMLLFLGLLATVYALNWQLALAATIVLPLHLVAFRYFKRSIKESSRAASEHLATATGTLVERLLGMEVVKSFTAEDRENAAFRDAIDQSRKSELRSKTYHVTQKIVADMLIGLGLLLLLGFGAFQVMRPDEHAMGVGTFIAFFWYVRMLYPSVLELMSGLAKMTKATASIERVFDLLETGGGEDQRGKPVEEVRGAITFEGVSFTYARGTQVLEDVHVTIPEGKVCAIVGPSGSGKSTLVSLLPRFILPSSGRIMLDGVDTADLDIHHLRRVIGFVGQECFLFNSSVMENLLYARPTASPKDVIEVATRTGAHQFIERLPEGYDTRLGQNGVELSRGEKQQLALTRAMLKNPQILVLDEATASVDIAQEQQIVPAVLELMQNKTTLMITHRMELLRHADMVVRIENGKVANVGTSPDAESVDSNADSDVKEGNPRSAESWLGLRYSAVILLALLLGTAASAPAVAAPAKAEPEPVLSGGEFLPQPGVRPVELDEVLEVIQLQAGVQMGYEPASDNLARTLDNPPVDLDRQVTLVRQLDDGFRLIQLGYKLFRTQPPHVWIDGATVGEEGALSDNPDLPEVRGMLDSSLGGLAEQNKQLSVGDLEVGTIALSYVEADRALAVLDSLGYQTVHFKGGKGIGTTEIIEPTKQIDPTQLPAVVAIPDASGTQLVGGSDARTGAFGQTTTPATAAPLPAMTSASPLMRLMVLYHPAMPEQFSDVLDQVRTVIDVPDRQILIEAMVLEVSETGLTKLGLEWQQSQSLPFTGDNTDNITSLKFGRLPRFSERDEAPLIDITAERVFGHFNLQIQALVRDGEARILSRPSVLTLNNRQASIRVGEDIPIATSVAGLQRGDKLSFDFDYVPIGILLNVRPRMNVDADEVSMQIDGVVSSEVPGQDLVLFDQEGNEVARAPRISSRRVQTYSRVSNNMPFIIGGLISRENSITDDKVPILGDLPLIGAAFRTRRKSELQREVIIVLTPYVLPEDQVVGRNLPKDEDAFDSFGQKLFRDAYRIRSEDVFDLGFIDGNETVNTMRRLANLVVRQNFRYADQPPFDEFVGDRLPGEEILVYRQMYEVIKRLGIDDDVSTDRLIFFRPDPAAPSGADVTFLWKHLAKVAGYTSTPYITQEKALFEHLDGKALALIYHDRPQQADAQLLTQPVPEIRLLDCPDRDTWGQLLWELNQPDDEGHERRALLIQSPSDLKRLRRAVVLKHTARLNASRQTLTLANFSTGRLLLMPTIETGRVYLIDAETAQYFFQTEHYYPAFQRRVAHGVEALRDAFRRPEVRRYLVGEDLPTETPADVQPPSLEGQHVPVSEP